MQESTDRVALIGILVHDKAAVEAVNAALHDFGDYIVGRMGLPMRDRGVNAISVVIDAPVNIINALTGKLGAVKGASAKALFENL